MAIRVDLATQDALGADHRELGHLVAQRILRALRGQPGLFLCGLLGLSEDAGRLGARLLEDLRALALGPGAHLGGHVAGLLHLVGNPVRDDVLRLRDAPFPPFTEEGLLRVLVTGGSRGLGREIAFAALHCTGGDILIATASLVLALVVAGQPGWPQESYRRVVMITVALGLGYTVFSEWLNLEVRQAWAYSDLMPTLPWLGTGLSPVLQWLVVPVVAFRWARRTKFR